MQQVRGEVKGWRRLEEREEGWRDEKGGGEVGGWKRWRREGLLIGRS